MQERVAEVANIFALDTATRFAFYLDLVWLVLFCFVSFGFVLFWFCFGVVLFCFVLFCFGFVLFCFVLVLFCLVLVCCFSFYV